MILEILANKKLRKTFLYSVFFSFVTPIALVIYGVAASRFSSIAAIASFFFGSAMLGALLFFIVYGLYDLFKFLSNKKARP